MTEDTLFNFSENNLLKPALQVAAEIHIAKLKGEGLLTEDKYVPAQLALELARVCGIASAKGRASAVAMASKELRETLALLPALPSAGTSFDDELAKFGIEL